MRTLITRKLLKQISSRLAGLLVVALLLGGALGFSPAQAATSQVGYKDFSFGSAYSPTGDKPQSKLWFNDGIWWGVLYNKASTSRRFEIYRFNWATDTWTTTGVMVDARTKSSADALWTGSKLYTVSSMSPGASGDVNIYVMRYSYDSTTKTYSLDSGFPVAVHNRGVETVVMDQDTTGRLWVTFTDANSSGGRNAYVTHTTANDTTWIAPYVIPVAGANTLKDDDISTLVAFSGKIGVMWSNQKDSTVYFAYHPDGTPDNNWISHPAVQGPRYADDHLNIKSLQADSSGQLFAIVKTSLNDVESSTSTKPLVLLLQLDAQGNWSRRTVWRIVDNVTRPIVLLDQQNRTIYAFTTVNYGSQDDGAIYYKSVSLDNPSMQFVEGRGTPFIVSSTDTHINNASSTKQALNSTTNLLVIAGDDRSDYYFHNKIVLGSGGVIPTASATNTIAPTHIPATSTPAPTFTSTPAPSPTLMTTPPGKTSLIAPTGSIGSTTPTYRWNHVSGSTWYYLWISRVNSDHSLTTMHNQWYESSAVCGGTTCSFAPSVTLSNGTYRWWVQGWNGAGYGPWSDDMNFTVSLPLPGKATLVSPAGNIGTRGPTYTWNEDSSATWYYLWVNGPSGNVIKQWYTAEQANCNGAFCSVTPTTLLSPGAHGWWIQTWNNAGYGPWSERMDFSSP